MYDYIFHRDSTKLGEEDAEMINYYNYCKINPGLTYNQFGEESAEVIQYMLEIEKLLSEKESKKKK